MFNKILLIIFACARKIPKKNFPVRNLLFLANSDAALSRFKLPLLFHAFAITYQPTFLLLNTRIGDQLIFDLQRTFEQENAGSAEAHEICD